MMSSLHRCFDMRLFSIHPTKHIVRAFVDYDLITDFHGRKVDLPRNIDQRALQHHWDMCCLENTPLWSLPFYSGALSIIPELTPSLLPNSGTSRGDLSKGTSKHASQALDTQASGAQTPSDLQSFRLNSFLASASGAYPQSPPPSYAGSQGHKLWRFGHEVIDDPARAAELWRQGHNVVPVESEAEGSDEKRGRSRSPVQWPCVGTVDVGHEEET